MIKVLFICLGNICRSPMAEIIFRDMVEKNGLSDEFIIASSATSSENVWNGIGAEVYPPAKRILARHGLSAEGKRAVQIKKSDYEKYDLFVCMDKSNVRNSQRIFHGDSEDKIRMLMDYTDRPADVSDPWYTGDFDKAYRDIYDGCEGLLKAILKQENQA